MANTAPPTPDPQAESPAPGGFKAKLPLIALVAVGLAVGGGTGAKLLAPMMAEKLGRGAAPAVAHAEEPEAEAEADSSDANGAPSVHLLENLVLNPAGSGGSRFLLLSVAIETGGPSTVTAFQARDAELRDIMLTALGSKTVDELTDINTREAIKAELLATISARFGKKAVKRLYFPQFVVQ